MRFIEVMRRGRVRSIIGAWVRHSDSLLRIWPGGISIISVPLQVIYSIRLERFICKKLELTPISVIPNMASPVKWIVVGGQLDILVAQSVNRLFIRKLKCA